MSLASKVALAGAGIFAATIIGLVHWSQNEDRKRLHEGVIRDQERQEKKRRNIQELNEQIQLREYLEKKESEQSVEGLDRPS